MSEGMSLPAGEVTARLTGFRSESLGRAGVKVDLDLPAAAVRQPLDTGATGSVAGENLRVELDQVGLEDSSGRLEIVELIVSRPDRY